MKREKCFLINHSYIRDRMQAEGRLSSGSTAPENAIFSRGVCFVPRKTFPKTPKILTERKKGKASHQLGKGGILDRPALDTSSDAEVT